MTAYTIARCRAGWVMRVRDGRSCARTRLRTRVIPAHGGLVWCCPAGKVFCRSRPYGIAPDCPHVAGRHPRCGRFADRVSDRLDRHAARCPLPDALSHGGARASGLARARRPGPRGARGWLRAGVAGRVRVQRASEAARARRDDDRAAVAVAHRARHQPGAYRVRGGAGCASACPVGRQQRSSAIPSSAVERSQADRSAVRPNLSR